MGDFCRAADLTDAGRCTQDSLHLGAVQSRRRLLFDRGRFNRGRPGLRFYPLESFFLLDRLILRLFLLASMGILG